MFTYVYFMQIYLIWVLCFSQDQIAEGVEQFINCISIFDWLEGT